jgi:uncharacterized RDD family membrane protein YckC
MYDCILLFSVLFFATAIIMPVTGQAIESGNVVYQAWLVLWSYLYFGWQWVAGGQTLGMRAWRIRVISRCGGNPGWQEASLRFLLSAMSWLPAAAGFIWVLIDKEKLAVHDRLSRTRLVITPAEKKTAN